MQHQISFSRIYYHQLVVSILLYFPKPLETVIGASSNQNMTHMKYLVKATRWILNRACSIMFQTMWITFCRNIIVIQNIECSDNHVKCMNRLERFGIVLLKFPSDILPCWSFHLLAAQLYQLEVQSRHELTPKVLLIQVYAIVALSSCCMAFQFLPSSFHFPNATFSTSCFSLMGESVVSQLIVYKFVIKRIFWWYFIWYSH